LTFLYLFLTHDQVKHKTSVEHYFVSRAYVLYCLENFFSDEACDSSGRRSKHEHES